MANTATNISTRYCFARTPLPPADLIIGKMPSDPSRRRRFGRLVCCLRKKKHFSQEKFAETMGVLRPYLSRIETGRILPLLDQHVKMANALNMKLSEFMSETWDKILYPRSDD
jgi:DNA-binding XRE family transcriptional regulator